MSDSINKEQLEAALLEPFKELLEGAESDIQTLVSQISADMAYAASTGNIRLQETLLAQLQALAARYQVRGSQAAWATLGTVIKTIFAIL